MEYVFTKGFVPYGEAGNDGGVGAEGDAREATGSAGGDSEEVDKDTLRRGHVGVHEDADGFAGFHSGEKSANEIILVDGAIAVHGAVTLDEGVDIGIVEGAHDDGKRMALEGMGECGKFPGTNVSGEKEDTFAPSVGAFEIFKAFVDHDAGDIFFGIAGKETKFGELASEGDEFSANDAAAIGFGHFREGDGQVAKTDAAEASVDSVNGERESDADGASERAGDHAKEFDPGPEEGVFEAFAQ